MQMVFRITIADILMEPNEFRPITEIHKPQKNESKFKFWISELYESCADIEIL